METKVCTKCEKEKPLEEIVRNSRKRDGYGSWCKQCVRDWHKKQDPDHVRERQKQWRKDNPERQKKLQNASARRQHERAKRAVVDAYGGKCTCCGESDIHFLTVEHITKEALERHKYDNGRRISGTKMLRMIEREGFPDDITVLCFNCNCARGQYGFCPHANSNPFFRRYAA